MATYVLEAVNLFVGGYDLTSDVFAHNLSQQVDSVENTTFTASGTTARSYLPGLENFSVAHQGYIDPDGSTGPDDVFDSLKGASQVVTVAPAGVAENALAYTGQRVDSALVPLEGTVGDMAGFSFNGQGTGALVRGFLLQSPSAAVSSSSASTGLQYSGGVASGEYLYASMHVIATTGSPTLDAIVQSDTVGFGSPTSRITFTQATAIGAQWGTRVAGPITDDYFRVSYTFGGTGSITFAVTVGIQ